MRICIVYICACLIFRVYRYVYSYACSFLCALATFCRGALLSLATFAAVSIKKNHLHFLPYLAAVPLPFAVVLCSMSARSRLP